MSEYVPITEAVEGEVKDWEVHGGDTLFITDEDEITRIVPIEDLYISVGDDDE